MSTFSIKIKECHESSHVRLECPSNGDVLCSSLSSHKLCLSCLLTDLAALSPADLNCAVRSVGAVLSSLLQLHRSRVSTHSPASALFAATDNSGGTSACLRLLIRRLCECAAIDSDHLQSMRRSLPALLGLVYDYLYSNESPTGSSLIVPSLVAPGSQKLCGAPLHLLGDVNDTESLPFRVPNECAPFRANDESASRTRGGCSTEGCLLTDELVELVRTYLSTHERAASSALLLLFTYFSDHCPQFTLHCCTPAMLSKIFDLGCCTSRECPGILYQEGSHAIELYVFVVHQVCDVCRRVPSAMETLSCLFGTDTDFPCALCYALEHHVSRGAVVHNCLSLLAFALGNVSICELLLGRGTAFVARLVRLAAPLLLHRDGDVVQASAAVLSSLVPALAGVENVELREWVADYAIEGFQSLVTNECAAALFRLLTLLHSYAGVVSGEPGGVRTLPMSALAHLHALSSATLDEIVGTAYFEACLTDEAGAGADLLATRVLAIWDAPPGAAGVSLFALLKMITLLLRAVDGAAGLLQDTISTISLRLVERVAVLQIAACGRERSAAEVGDAALSSVRLTEVLHGRTWGALACVVSQLLPYSHELAPLALALLGDLVATDGGVAGCFGYCCEEEANETDAVRSALVAMGARLLQWHCASGAPCVSLTSEMRDTLSALLRAGLADALLALSARGTGEGSGAWDLLVVILSVSISATDAAHAVQTEREKAGLPLAGGAVDIVAQAAGAGTGPALLCSLALLGSPVQMSSSDLHRLLAFEINQLELLTLAWGRNQRQYSREDTLERDDEGDERYAGKLTDDWHQKLGSTVKNAFLLTLAHRLVFGRLPTEALHPALLPTYLAEQEADWVTSCDNILAPFFRNLTQRHEATFTVLMSELLALPSAASLGCWVLTTVPFNPAPLSAPAGKSLETFSEAQWSCWLQVLSTEACCRSGTCAQFLDYYFRHTLQFLTKNVSSGETEDVPAPIGHSAAASRVHFLCDWMQRFPFDTSAAVARHLLPLVLALSVGTQSPPLASASARLFTHLLLRARSSSSSDNVVMRWCLKVLPAAAAIKDYETLASVLQLVHVVLERPRGEELRRQLSPVLLPTVQSIRGQLDAREPGHNPPARVVRVWCAVLEGRLLLRCQPRDGASDPATLFVLPEWPMVLSLGMDSVDVNGDDDDDDMAYRALMIQCADWLTFRFHAKSPALSAPLRSCTPAAISRLVRWCGDGLHTDEDSPYSVSCGRLLYSLLENFHRLLADSCEALGMTLLCARGSLPLVASGWVVAGLLHLLPAVPWPGWVPLLEQASISVAHRVTKEVEKSHVVSSQLSELLPVLAKAAKDRQESIGIGDREEDDEFSSLRVSLKRLQRLGDFSGTSSNAVEVLADGGLHFTSLSSAREFYLSSQSFFAVEG